MPLLTRSLWTIVALFAVFASLGQAALVLSPPFQSSPSPELAGPIGKHCTEGEKHTGDVRGSNVTIGGVPTYVSKPPNAQFHDKKKAILFFPDIYGPFYINNQLLEDYFASEGFYVLGIDYFYGDPVQAHDGEPGFNQTAWVNKSRAQAEAAIPKWIEGVRAAYGSDTNYGAVGYCFGGLYSAQVAATDNVVAGAFAHPSGLTEDHFNNIRKPLLLSCADGDTLFNAASRNRAADILTAKKATYNLQVFSGVTHGFATRGNLTDENGRSFALSAVPLQWF